MAHSAPSRNGPSHNRLSLGDRSGSHCTPGLEVLNAAKPLRNLPPREAEPESMRTPPPTRGWNLTSDGESDSPLGPGTCQADPPTRPEEPIVPEYLRNSLLLGSPRTPFQDRARSLQSNILGVSSLRRLDEVDTYGLDGALAVNARMNGRHPGAPRPEDSNGRVDRMVPTSCENSPQRMDEADTCGLDRAQDGNARIVGGHLVGLRPDDSSDMVAQEQ